MVQCRNSSEFDLGCSMANNCIDKSEGLFWVMTDKM